MKRILSTFTIFFFVLSVTQAQNVRTPVALPDVEPGKATVSGLRTAEPSGEARHNGDEPVNYYLRLMEREKFGFEHVKEIKKRYAPKRGQQAMPLKTDATDATPVIGQQYDTNGFDGSYPPDNNIAVSTAGWIVSVVNSTVRIYNAAGQFQNSKTFNSFVNDNSLNSILFDPKVLYDSGSDRFFLVLLHGYTSTTSNVLLFFSKTSNPMDGWNYYKIPMSANTATSNRWADFPNIGVSNNEVYVTLNLFNNNDYFSKVVLYQITKQTGYNNATLQYQVWDNIKDNQNDSPFTLVPVSYGHQGNYGPGIFLVSTEDPGSSNKVQVFDLTQNIGNNPQLLGYSASIPAFQIGGNAVQPGNGSDDLDIGDCRMKSAFYLNGTIHCVFTSNFQNGWNGINYSRVNVSNMTATNKKFGTVGRDIGYPAVASFSNNIGDRTVLIGYEESSASIYPSLRAVVVDDAMNFGTPLQLKTGVASINVAPSTADYERWGDYLNIHRRFGVSSPTVWVFGIYGRSNGTYGNNAVEIINTAETNTATPEPERLPATVYPNPVESFYTVVLQIKESADVRFDLYDASGRLVQHMATKSLTPGKFQFGFERGSLPAGVYFLRVSGNEKTWAHEKVVVQ